jgi:hypothetical protein
VALCFNEAIDEKMMRKLSTRVLYAFERTSNIAGLVTLQASTVSVFVFENGGIGTSFSFSAFAMSI